MINNTNINNNNIMKYVVYGCIWDPLLMDGLYNGTSIYKMDDLGCTPIYGKHNIPSEPKT